MSNFILNIYLFLLLWRYRGYFFSDKGHRSYWPPYVLDFFFVLFKKKTKRLFQNTVPLHIFLNINITERDRNCVKCLVCVCVYMLIYSHVDIYISNMCANVNEWFFVHAYNIYIWLLCMCVIYVCIYLSCIFTCVCIYLSMLPVFVYICVYLKRGYHIDKYVYQINDISIYTPGIYKLILFDIVEDVFLFHLLINRQKLDWLQQASSALLRDYNML